MQTISVHAEREYDIRFVENWQIVFAEIAKSHAKVLVIAPVSYTHLTLPTKRIV